MYTIVIKETKTSRPEELCSFEDQADAVSTFHDVCNDYYKVTLLRNRTWIMEQVNPELAV